MRRRGLLEAAAFVLPILILILSTSSGGENVDSIHLDVVFRDFARVSNMYEVFAFLVEKSLENDVDMLRVLDFLHSKDFKAINDYLWESRDWKNVR